MDALFLFIYISTGLSNVLFISFSGFGFFRPHLFSLNFIFSHGDPTLACSGERDRMSAAAARAYRRIRPRAFLLNWRERSRSIQFNPSGKAL